MAVLLSPWIPAPGGCCHCSEYPAEQREEGKGVERRKNEEERKREARNKRKGKCKNSQDRQGRNREDVER